VSLVPHDVLGVDLVAVEDDELAERPHERLPVAEDRVEPAARPARRLEPPRVRGRLGAVADAAQGHAAEDEREQVPRVPLRVLVGLQAALGEVEAGAEEGAGGAPRAREVEVLVGDALRGLRACAVPSELSPSSCPTGRASPRERHPKQVRVLVDSWGGQGLRGCCRPRTERHR